MKRLIAFIAPWVLCCSLIEAQQPDSKDAKSAVRGSIVEDRAARKLLEAGDARYDADEQAKAVEVWQSLIERYPRSKVRLDAHMRLGNHLLDRDRAYDRARVHFEAADDEEVSKDEAQRAEATLKVGICYYEARNFGKCFKVMRDVVENFPVSPQVNQAYYYIGLGHFQLGHYSRAISALEKVGTTLANSTESDAPQEKVEAGKRLYVKIEDADLAALPTDSVVRVRCETTQGDVEDVDCSLVGRAVRVVLGSTLTELGKPKKNNGIIEVKGDDKVKVTYVDAHTADRQFDRKVLKEIIVVGNAIADIMDGAFAESLRGVVLGKPVNIQIVDGDKDLTDDADAVNAIVEVYREKTPEELEAEQANAAKVAKEKQGDAALPTAEELLDDKIDPLKKIDELAIVLKEVKLPKARAAVSKTNQAGETASGAADASATPKSDPAAPAAASSKPPAPVAAEVEDPSTHSGTFRATIEVTKADAAVAGDQLLQALPNDIVRINYVDELNATDAVRKLATSARVVEGNLGGVRVTRAQISDQELRIQTQLKTASALTNIGNRYKEFGLKKNADAKYDQALKVCEEIVNEATKLGGRLLEETYVRLWHIYYEMDALDKAATMCERLQREFPDSGFVDDALLQLADVVRKQGDIHRAIGVYSRLVNMPTSQLRGEAQFGIAECYEDMAKKSTGPGAAQFYDQAFQEYKKVFDRFPESGRVGEAVAKMASYYYQQKDYARAVDIFESVLTNQPDAKFLDVILFNYGRCLFRMDRRADARKQFDQLIGDFPESPLAAEAKRISEALAKAPAPAKAAGEAKEQEPASQ